MRWMGTVLREVFGLFVDDGSFALAIAVWLGIAWAVFPRIGLAHPWGGVLLFAGLGTILLESAVRFSRKEKRR